MYAWIWRKLPFGLWGKLTGSIGLAAATMALLWYVVFPWATPLLPFDDVQIEGTQQQSGDGPAAGDPDADAPDEIPYSTESNDAHPSESPSATPSKSKSTTTIPGD